MSIFAEGVLHGQVALVTGASRGINPTEYCTAKPKFHRMSKTMIAPTLREDVPRSWAHTTDTPTAKIAVQLTNRRAPNDAPPHHVSYDPITIT